MKQILLAGWLTALVIVVVVGCSSGSGASSSEVTLDGDAVKSQSIALSSALSAARSDDGVTVAANLASAGNAVASFIPQTKSASRSQTSRGSGTTTCTCTTAASKACTFDGCTIASAKVSGTISWTNNKLACAKLTFDVPALGQTQIGGESLTIGATHVEVTCDVTYSPTTFDGTLKVTGTAEVNNVNYSWSGTVAAADVTLAAKTFTSGTVDVDATVTAVSAARGTEQFHASGAVAFP